MQASEPTVSLPSFWQHGGSPAVPAPAGIAIASPGEIHRGAPFALYGGFAVSKQDASAFSGHLLNAVVVLVRGPLPATLNVGRGRLLFEDDLIDEGDRVLGYFNLDLFAELKLTQEPNRYWITASIFEHVSDLLTVEVR